MTVPATSPAAGQPPSSGGAAGPFLPNLGLKSSGAAGLLASVLFGIVFALVVTPRGFLAGTSSYWHTQVEDIAQYYSGYLAYLRAPWSLPLLAIPSLDWPTGTVVTFVDAIPLFSLVLKLLSPIVPLPANPFGVWVLLCFALQGAAAWFAASQLRENDWWVLGLAVFFCVLMPSLTAMGPPLHSRIGHLSLLAQFIPLFSLGLYIRTQRHRRSHTGAWTLLLVSAFYINFYLTAMAIAVLAACQLDLYRKTANTRDLAVIAVPLAAIAVSVPPMLGTAFGHAVPDPGFGYYSMNLLSPVAQGSLVSMPFFVDATGGQYEGYNYLGIGLIGLIALSATRLARAGADWQRPGLFLTIALAGCIVYALSNEVYAGPLHLLHWRVPEPVRPLFETFRSSGRFFWPVSYALVLYSLARFAHLRPAARIGLAAAVVLVQAADLQPTFAGIKQSLKRQADEPADIAQWNAALAGVETIHAFPKFKCDGALIREILPLQMVAARGGYNLTTGFISRYGADCGADAIAAEIAGSDPTTSAYVFTRAQFSDAQIGSYLPAGAQCRQLDIWMVCRKDRP